MTLHHPLSDLDSLMYAPLSCLLSTSAIGLILLAAAATAAFVFNQPIFPDLFLVRLGVPVSLLVTLYRISTPATANLESGHFSEIRPSPAPAKYLVGFGGCQCSWTAVHSVNYG